MFIVTNQAYLLNILLESLALLFIFHFLYLSKLGKHQLVSWALLPVITGVSSLLGQIGSPIGVALLYLINSRQSEERQLLIFNVLLSSTILSLTTFFISIVLSFGGSLNNFHGIPFVLILNIIRLIVCLVLAFISKLIQKYNPINAEMLPYISLLLGIFDLVMFLYVLIGQELKILTTFAVGTFFFIAFQCLFFGGLLIIIWKSLRKQYEVKLEKDKITMLECYTKQLEHDQLELRKIQHDYKNLLASLRGLLTLKDSPQFVKYAEELEIYSQDRLKINQRFYSDLSNVENPLIKNVLLTKFFQWEEHGINFSFECKEKSFLETKANYDLVRILGILLDNACEEVLRQKNGQIWVLIYQQNNQFELTVENTCQKNVPHFKTLSKAGYSSKEKHSGLGLAIVQELVNGITGAFLQQNQTEGRFKMQLLIVREGENQ